MRHLASVREGTVVLLMREGRPPILKKPGEYVWPSPRPWEDDVTVLPVAIGPVRLLVRIADLTTLDGHRLELLELRVVVQFLAADVLSGLTDLAAEHRGELGNHLAETVRRAVDASVRAAVHGNRRADLRRQSLISVLEDRWVPRAFAGGVLTRQRLELVTEVWSDKPAHPKGSGDGANSSRPSGGSDDPPTTEQESVGEDSHHVRSRGLELTMDGRLSRLWRRHFAFDPIAIAGAHSGGRSTVIAVIDRDPPAYETREMWEEVGDAYRDPDPCLLLVRGNSYEEIVTSWFSQLEVGSGLAPVTSSDHNRDRLVVRLPKELTHPRWQGPDGSQVAALRHLLPHKVVDVAVGNQ